MPHSYCRVWIHAIWATKNRAPFISSDIEQYIHNYILDELASHKCYPKIINGMPDHLHTLFLLNPKFALANIMKQMKGTSSEYINQNNLTSDRFSWQIGYCAYSVSESMVNRVFNYILRQKEHHQRKDFNTEFDEFIRKHGFQEEQ
ncbi:MAG: IS200/IS605 family transposase [Citrobacter freundii]|nr:MAG: IS200/IS605 family transposase [Citrobacter freundii]